MNAELVTEFKAGKNRQPTEPRPLETDDVLGAETPPNSVFDSHRLNRSSYRPETSLKLTT